MQRATSVLSKGRRAPRLPCAAPFLASSKTGVHAPVGVLRRGSPCVALPSHTFSQHRFSSHISAFSDSVNAADQPVSSDVSDGGARFFLRDAHELPAFTSLQAAVGQSLAGRFTTLLEDRRAGYRDSVILDVIAPQRRALREELARFLGTAIPSAAELAAQTNGSSPSPAGLSRVRHVRAWKQLWLAKHAASDATQSQDAYHLSLVAYTLQFYEVLLATDAVGNEADVALILDELRTTDFLEPNAGVYQSILWSLPALCHVRSSSSSASASASSASTPEKVVVGEQAEVDRVALGDAACRYMGQAVARQRDQQQRFDTPVPGLAPVNDGLWASFVTLAALTHMSAPLFDLWWNTFLTTHDPSQASPTTSLPTEMTPTPGAALPFAVAYAGLSWCATSQDVERAMRLFQLCQVRGMTNGDAMSMPPGALLRRTASSELQAVQLHLLVKMLATAKSMRFDGGVRDVFVKDIKALTSADVLRHAPWGVVNDLMSALTVPSAMQLLQLRAAPRKHKSRSGEEEKQHADTSSDDKAPFFVWASLLRRCAKDHALDEAESLFQFACHQFHPSTAEKRELVEIMMRMYATLSPSDYASATHIFLEHVLRTPEGQSPVTPDTALYNLLIKAADTRNAAMMTFLEACADGVATNTETFEALIAANPYSTVASLSRKLPHDYGVSELDSQMRIPGNADAHARREEALEARHKPRYDSTGDSA